MAPGYMAVERRVEHMAAGRRAAEHTAAGCMAVGCMAAVHIPLVGQAESAVRIPLIAERTVEHMVAEHNYTTGQQSG